MFRYLQAEQNLSSKLEDGRAFVWVGSIPNDSIRESARKPHSHILSPCIELRFRDGISKAKGAPESSHLFL